MEITEVRVKLVDNPKERLRAFCSITVENDFVIRDLKVIDGDTGPFVAMPSRKLSEKCPHCGHKNHLRSRFCNGCGKKLDENRITKTGRRNKLHADIAHPINAACRQRIQEIVVKAYLEEMERSQQPGYKPVDLEVDEEGLEGEFHDENAEPAAVAESHDNERTPARRGRENREAKEPPKPRSSQQEDDNGGGYDELIADLKRSVAKHHRSRQEESGSTFTTLTQQQTEQETQDEIPEDLPTVKKPETQKPASRKDDGFGEGIL